MEKTLIEKLGIELGSNVLLISPKFISSIDRNFGGNMAVAATPAGLGKLNEKFDFVLVWIETMNSFFPLLEDLKKHLNPKGIIWIIFKKKQALPKNAEKTIGKLDITRTAKKSELVDNKITSVSNSAYALRLVKPSGKKEKS